MSYAPGGTRALCDRCHFEYRLSELKREWTGLMVCRADYDPRPAELKAPRVKPEGLPKPNARPEFDDEAPNTTTQADL
jgi:hypothetical protein